MAAKSAGELGVWKWILLVVVVLAGSCGGGVFWAYSAGKFDKIKEWAQPGTKPTEVRLEPARKGDLVRTVSAPGAVESRTKVVISAQVSARIVALPKREGEAVKAGDLLVRLDDRDLRAALEAARADLKAEESRLEGVRANLANATAELGRRRELFDSKDISRAELDLAEAEFRRAQATVEAAMHGIDASRQRIIRAERDLDNTVITAPFDGTVTRVNAEVGELVLVGTLNNPASAIMEVHDLSTMLVRARVDESNIAPVQIGQKSKVYINSFPNRVFDGMVDRIKPQQMQDRDGTKYFESEVLLEVPSDVRLYAGMTANVDIEVQTLRDVLRVPSQAIVDRAVDDLPRAVVDGSPNVDRAKKFARVVYTVEDGKAKAVPVAVGASDLTTTVVLAGLEVEERIVVGPAKALIGLRDGQRVAEATEKPGERSGETGQAGVGDRGAGKGS